MATKNLSPAPQAPAAPRVRPLTKPGYGKRSMPGQLAPHADDFALLGERERYIASYIDQMPEHSVMDIKSLAAQLPLYGQQAVGSALRALAVAGYLRRIRCLVGDGGQVRWVYRTFWTRTARDNEWWNAHLTPDGVIVGSGAVPPVTVPVDAAPEPVPAEAVPATPAVPQQPAPGGPSPAYVALARLGLADARLALSAADCEALEARAAEWLARGVDTDYLTRALTAGLPAHVDSPVGFVRRRLTDKIPPALPPTPAPAPAPAASGVPVHRVLVECTECGTPGRPEAIPDGLCRPCHRAANNTPAPPEAPTGLPTQQDVRGYAAQIRADLFKMPA